MLAIRLQLNYTRFQTNVWTLHIAGTLHGGAIRLVRSMRLYGAVQG